MKYIKIGYYPGDMKEVAVQDDATARDVIRASGLVLGKRTVNFNRASFGRSISLVDDLDARVPQDMEVWLMAPVSACHPWQTGGYRAQRRRLNKCQLK